ncbi:MAG: tRNA lysidine(34) synthetase TilS [Eubacteriales bacterium]|nr:tRNA lysidine(34) synthetase TilS [Eubacteriales bacterium]
MQKVFDYIRQHHMIEAKEKVIVGVSGGADSLCLLFVLKRFAQEIPFDMTAVHVEHGIRGKESMDDAAYVEKICRAQNIEYKCISCRVPDIAQKEKLTLEEAARKARYEAFEQIREKLGAGKIAVAHNKNDQAETMLFQIMRGSGLKGAAGISPVRDHIIRPLLECTREEIEDYLKSRKIAWRTDSTNYELDYTRNCLRHKILPELAENVNAKSVEHLAALGEELRQVQAYISGQVEKITDETAVCRAGSAEIEIEKLQKQTGIIQEYVIREILKRAGCGLKDIGRGHIRNIRELAEGQSGRSISLPGRWSAKREFDILWIGREFDGERQNLQIYPVIPGAVTAANETYVFDIFPYSGQNIPQKIYTKWFDYDKIGSDLILRTRQPGDFLVVNSQGGRKKLKSYFIEEKISQKEREQIVLLAKENEVIWVTGYRISEAYKVTPETKMILEVRRIEKRDGREDQCIDTGRKGR